MSVAAAELREVRTGADLVWNYGVNYSRLGVGVVFTA
jgi:hypothetical protein